MYVFPFVGCKYLDPQIAMIPDLPSLCGLFECPATVPTGQGEPTSRKQETPGPESGGFSGMSCYAPRTLSMSFSWAVRFGSSKVSLRIA